MAKGALFMALLAVGSAQAASVPVAATSTMSGVKVYPNPWRVDKHANMSVKVEGVPAASTVKFFTVSGREVKTLLADSGGVANWDRMNDNGEPVASGIYIYLIIDPQGNDASGKVAIIK